MERRVYRGKCPNENLFEIEFDGDCRNCERYLRCKRKERQRRKRVRRQIKCCVFGFLTLLLIGIIALRISSTANASKKTGQETQTASSTIIIDHGNSDPSKISIDVSVPTEAASQESSGITIANNIEVFASNSETIVVEVMPQISANGPGANYYYELSYEDKVYVAKVVYAESRGEIFEGQVAVAATVLNRYVSGDARFDRRTIYSVVTQPYQYASIANVTLEDLANCPSCMEAVEAACKGWDPTRIMFADGAKFFFNPDGDLSEEARDERTGIETYRIGSHLFHNDFNR